MKEFAIYKGEEFLFIGTAQECAEHLNVKTDTIRYYASPAYLRKLERRKARNYLIAVRLDDEE